MPRHLEGEIDMTQSARPKRSGRGERSPDPTELPSRPRTEAIWETPRPRAARGVPRRSWKRTLQDILWRTTSGTRPNPSRSFKTQPERASGVFRCFRDIHALGFKIRNPYCLGGRHVGLVQDWTAPAAARASHPDFRRRRRSSPTSEPSHAGSGSPAWCFRPRPMSPTRRWSPGARRRPRTGAGPRRNRPAMH